MFDKFGEFDSFEELNRAAAAQLMEGDTDAVYALAKENGLDPEDAEDYIAGEVSELCTARMAALGKLMVEAEDLKPEEIMQDWLSYIRVQVMERDDMCLAVRKKGKSLRGCIAVLLAWSFRHAKEVDREVVKEAAKTVKEISTRAGGRAWLGIPGMGTAHTLIREYYCGGAEK